jgi:two-component system chemotaxis response regulator CheB
MRAKEVSRLEPGRVLRAAGGAGEIEFELEAGRALLAVFAPGGRSYAACYDPAPGPVAATGMAAALEPMRAVGRGAVVKAVFAGLPVDSPAPARLAAALREHGFVLASHVCRGEGKVSGVVDFANARLRVARDAGRDAAPSRKPLPVMPAATAAPRRVRALIVDDSKTIRTLLTQILSQDPGIEVVGSVEDPLKAEQAIAELKPDVVTLDIHMPGLDGVELLKRYLSKHPVPTVMISSITREEGPQVFNALEAGAVDYIQKPTFAELPTHGPLIAEKVKLAALAKVRCTAVSTRGPAVFAGGFDPSALILLGASTGGTEALKDVLTRLPADIPPILIVQHIPAVFSKAFAQRLDTLCAFDVKEAEEGDEVRPGRALVAPGGFQMEVASRGAALRVRITGAPPVNRHKPSVDHLFMSALGVARARPRRALVAGILTGMGADGAAGLLELRKAGARTVAQDEATSVVYGMPRAAAERGAAERVLPLGEIAGALAELSRAKARRAG